MALNIVDNEAVLRINSLTNLAPTLTTGQVDITKTDKLEIVANGPQLTGFGAASGLYDGTVSATDRVITINAKNDAGLTTDTNMHIRLGGDGKSMVFLPTYNEVATLPTNGPEYYGGLAVVEISGVFKLYISTTAGWTVVGAQT